MVPPPTTRDESDREQEREIVPRDETNDHHHQVAAQADRPAARSPRRERRPRSHRQEYRMRTSTSSSSLSSGGEDQDEEGAYPLSSSLVPSAYGTGPKGEWVPDDGLPVFNKANVSHAMAGARPQRRPLLDLVKNEWMYDASQTSPPSSSGSDRGEPSWLAMVRAPRLRRYILLYTVLVLSLIICFRWLEPQWLEYNELNKSLGKTDKTMKGIYGVNLRPQFPDMINIRTLDETHLPHAAGDPKAAGADKRLVIVGDVHGCKDELSKLLEKVSFNKNTDHLIMTGDMLAKGPQSLETIDMLRDMGASCVRGNNEDRVLLLHRSLNMAHVALPGPDENTNSTMDDLEEESFNHGDYRDRALAAKLNPKQLEYLKSCPVILKLGNVPEMGEVVVVHAGLAAGVPLNNQDPYNVINMRTVDLETHVPSEKRDGTAWSKLWNKYQATLPTSDRTTVIYGHYAKRGLSLKQYSKGLDSDCLRGGKLSAFVIEGGNAESSPAGQKTVSSRVVNVKCENHVRGGGLWGRLKGASS